MRKKLDDALLAGTLKKKFYRNIVRKLFKSLMVDFKL